MFKAPAEKLSRFCYPTELLMNALNHSAYPRPVCKLCTFIPETLKFMHLHRKINVNLPRKRRRKKEKVNKIVNEFSVSNFICIIQ